MNLIEALIKAGYPKEDLFHHETDLYVFVNDTTEPIVRRYYRNQHLPEPEKFHDQITGQLMYDCSFQYNPYWDRLAVSSIF